MTNTEGAVKLYDQHADGTTSVVLGTAAAAFDPSNDKVRTFEGVTRGTIVEFRETSAGAVLFTIPATELCYFLVTAKNGAWNLSKVIQGVTASGNNTFTGLNTFDGNVVVPDGNNALFLGTGLMQVNKSLIVSGQSSFPDPTNPQSPVTKAYGDANYLGGGGGGGLDLTKTVFFDDFVGGVKNADTVLRLYTGMGAWQVSANGSNSVYDISAYSIADTNGALFMKTDGNNNRRMAIYQNAYRLDPRETSLNWAMRFQMSDSEGGSDRDTVTFAGGFVQASTFPTTLTPGTVSTNIIGVWHVGSNIKVGIRSGGSDVVVVDAGAYSGILNTFKEFQITLNPDATTVGFVDIEIFIDGVSATTQSISKTLMPDPADNYSPAFTILGDNGLFEPAVSFVDYFGFEQGRA